MNGETLAYFDCRNWLHGRKALVFNGHWALDDIYIYMYVYHKTHEQLACYISEVTHTFRM